MNEVRPQLDESVFSSVDLIGEQPVTSSDLYAAEPDAKDVTARLIADAGFDPVYVGDLAPGARLLENSSGLTHAPAGRIGPFLYRYGRPGELLGPGCTSEPPQVAWRAPAMAVRLTLMTRITGLSRKNTFVLTIRDADEVAAALRQALLEASSEERPGLERAVALVESTASATETRLRARWVRSRLAAVGFTGDVGAVAAVKALRQAEPGLSLLAAVQLQREAVAHPE